MGPDPTPAGSSARDLNGHHALEVTKSEAVDGKWVRYHVRDSRGEEHCVGVRAEGFFTQIDLEAMASDESDDKVDVRDSELDA